jgi:hypothetical protein
MARQRKRRHHFVPRFYLKYFSDPAAPGTIGLWNVNRELFIANAAISSQAYEIELYGKDDKLEELLSEMESRVSDILALIKDSLTLPPYNSNAREWLYLFLMFQAERTRATASDTESAFKQVFKGLPMGVQPATPRQSLSDSSILRLSLLPGSVPLIMDLGAKLVINKSPREFVTSDNPVVRYNQFMEVRKWPASGAGWSLPGLQIFFPVSPLAAIVLYDQDLYVVGNDNRDAVEVHTTAELNWLNGLQYLVAEGNVYFSPTTDEIYATRMHKRWAHKRKPRFSVNELQEKNPDPKSTVRRSLVVTSMNDLRVGLELPFVTFKVPPESRKLGPTMWNPRNAQVEAIMERLYPMPGNPKDRVPK